MLLRHRRVPSKYVPYVQAVLVILQNSTELPNDTVMHDSVRQGVKNRMLAYECTEMNKDVYLYMRNKEREEQFCEAIDNEHVCTIRDWCLLQMKMHITIKKKMHVDLIKAYLKKCQNKEVTILK